MNLLLISKPLILLAFYRAYSRRFEASKISCKSLIALKKIRRNPDFCCNERRPNFIKVYSYAVWSKSAAFLEIRGMQILTEIRLFRYEIA
nr:MAG TPA: hypothetical protein [Caudoviricetes sp.]